MIYTIRLLAHDIAVTYSSEDGYEAKRFATLLAKSIEEAGEHAAILSGACIRYRAAAEVSPAYSIDVCGRQMDITARGVLALEAVQGYFDRLLEEGKLPHSEEGRGDIDHPELSNRYAFSRQGDHRVMFYNLLWSNDHIYEPRQRANMSIDLVREFSPDVVGFQESNVKKRGDLSSSNIELLLDAIGYKEVAVEVENSYKNSNATPLFYNTAKVDCLDGGYVWYRDQAEHIGQMDRSSKSMTWGLFEVKATGERYIAASTHMCTQVDEIREMQAKEACTLFAVLHEKYGVPVIVGGDFNSRPIGKGYLYYRNEAKHPDAYEHATVYACDTATHHPYPKRDPDTELIMPTKGAFYHAPERAIDHIFCPYLDPEKIKVFGVVINSYSLAASDHFPVYVDFSI